MALRTHHHYGAECPDAQTEEEASKVNGNMYFPRPFDPVFLWLETRKFDDITRRIYDVYMVVNVW